MVNKPKTQASHEPEALVIRGVGGRRGLLVCYCGKQAKYTYDFTEIIKKIHRCEKHKAN